MTRMPSTPLPALTLVAALLAGCGGGSSSSPGTPTPTPEPAALKPVSSANELEASLKAGLTAIENPQNPESALSSDAAGAGSGSGNFTGTYTQDVNVDEFDAVRYDGEHLFVAPRRYLPCCFFAAAGQGDGATGTGTPSQPSIRILATDPAGVGATLAGTIPLEDGISVQGMYLDGDRMFALTSTQVYGGYGDFFASVALWAPEKLGYRVYDVSDPAAPALEVDVSIDGVFVDSRRVGDVVYIVSRHTPVVEGIIYDVRTAAEQAHNEALLAGVTLDDLLPKMRVDGAPRTLVDPARCYLATDDTQGYPVITSVTAVPISNPSAATTTCYNEPTYGIYVSQQSLYFTEIRQDPATSDAATRIHKFALAGTTLSYRGSGDVAGQVWRGGQADFRMDEFDGDLRLLASTWEFGSDDFVDHKLFVLRESPSALRLDIIGELPNANRPTEIGKPNEALYGVRFLGDRAYAVTFEQIDPLYVIDLADPRDPRIAGELMVTGFSDFLHPVTGELLLGLGTSAAGGVKLELFDISDISDPLSRGSIQLGGPGTYSEARYDRHAFTYQANAGSVDRFAIPATVYDPSAQGGAWEPGLHLFEIHDKTDPALAALQGVGTIRPPVEDTPWVFDSRNRSFIHDDTVFYVRGEEVWAAEWIAPTVVNGPF